MMKTLILRFLDILIPPTCALCNERVSEDATLCPQCFNKLHFITKPRCKICGRPFDFTITNDSVCANCLTNPPLFAKARSVLVYDELAKKLVLGFKNGDKLYLASLLTKMMVQIATDFISDVDIIIPIPLHRWRLLKRKYNQSAILAKNLSKRFNKTYNPDLLKRIRSTPNQGHLSAKERRKNVANAFHLTKSHVIREKTVLLIDDVLTTGATANECTKVLLKAGAKQVFLLTFASTLLDKSKQ